MRDLLRVLGKTKQDELVSVLMAIYNTKAEYIDEAIKSILDQTYKYIEIVIIDDGSDDPSTLECLSKYTDKRIRIIRNEKNIGLTKSLNKGFELCKGRYIARLDSDDLSMKDRIRKQYNYIRKKGYMIVACNWIIFPKKRMHPLYSYNSDNFKVAMVFCNQGPCHSTFFLDKEKLIERRLKYNEKYRTAQDYAFLCDCLSMGERIGLCKHTLVGWREHDNQISLNQKRQQDVDAESIRVSYIHNNFHLSLTESEEFVDAIGEFTYANAIDEMKPQMELELLLRNNPSKVVDYEIHKYWFRQAVNRLAKKNKSDFIKSKMFKSSLRLDRLLYTLTHVISERSHYLFQAFTKI